MNILFFLLSVVLVTAGHVCKARRWARLIGVYERPRSWVLLRAMGLGYELSFLLPFKLGDLFRAFYAGRRMKSGIGLSLATVIVDRFLDVVAVALIFAVLYLAGVSRALIQDSARFYILAALVLLAGLALLRALSTPIKRFTVGVCSIFNDSIRLRGERFAWVLINAFRDLWRTDLKRILLDSLLIWAGYLSSYVCFGLYMRSISDRYGLVEVIVTLFSRANLNLSSLRAAAAGAGELRGQLMFYVFLLLPPLLLILLSLLPAARAEAEDEDKAQYQKILPQSSEQDQLRFLNDYFSARSPEMLKKFIAMNRNVSIIADYSAGSDASTLLCMEDGELFYRKFVFGTGRDKLSRQLAWLRGHEGDLPLCRILRSEETENSCCYDMEYRSEAVGMFQFAHSHPLPEVQALLLKILDAVERGLYAASDRPADPEDLARYLRVKVRDNLELLEDSRELHELMRYDTLIINHREYRNLPAMRTMFDEDHLREIFAGDRCADIHGDLTVENIICTEKAGEADFYIIDPNVGNLHDSKYLDYGKLLQSLHGGYEFLMKTSAVTVSKNRIDFVYARSAVYDALHETLRGYLKERFGEEGTRSVYCHELIHWLRLLPYKIRKDSRLAPIFYAGFVMVANDVYNWYEQK